MKTTETFERDCTSVGHTLTLNAGKLTATNRTRWQGSRDGIKQRWNIPAGITQDPDQDDDAYLRELHERACAGEFGEPRTLSHGDIVR